MFMKINCRMILIYNFAFVRKYIALIVDFGNLS